MKAQISPRVLTKSERRQITSRISMGVDTLLDAKKRTMAHRTLAVVTIASCEYFRLGKKRARDFYDKINAEIMAQQENMLDTGDDILFANLRRLGLDDLAREIVEDYKNELVSAKGTIFEQEVPDD